MQIIRKYILNLILAYLETASLHFSNWNHALLKFKKKKIKAAEAVHNLGVIFDSIMSMSSHISSNERSLNYHLRNIGRIRSYIDNRDFAVCVCLNERKVSLVAICAVI